MNPSSIVLIIEFDWPTEITKELATLVRKFHDLVNAADWIEEKVAASGGIGGNFNSIWVIELENYAGLDTFLHGENEVSSNFNSWTNQMAKVKLSTKDKVQFL